MEPRSGTASPAMSVAADAETVEEMVHNMLREKKLTSNLTPPQVSVKQSHSLHIEQDTLAQPHTTPHTHTHTHTHTLSLSLSLSLSLVDITA